MHISFLLSVATTVITAAFAFMVLARYRAKGGWHLLSWGIGLVLYSLGTAAQALLFGRFNPVLFKLWYWAGALAVAPWLGQGSVFLLVRKGKRAWISFWVILALSVIGLVYIAQTGLDASAYRPGVDLTEQYKLIFTASGGEKAIRTVLAIVMNTLGTILLVGGALYSGFLFWRKKVLPHRMWGNVLIAAGGLLPATGGTLILLGVPSLKYLAQFLGGILLFIGFLVATQSVPQRQESQAPA